MMRWLSIAHLLLAASVAACSGSRAYEEEKQMPARTIEAVLAAHNDSLMARPGVVGTAIGRCDGAPCIRIFVRDSASARDAALADRLEGYPVRVEVTGTFHAR
jgi:hypothetical protein